MSVLRLLLCACVFLVFGCSDLVKLLCEELESGIFVAFFVAAAAKHKIG
jgi:hypothetical protein